MPCIIQTLLYLFALVRLPSVVLSGNILFQNQCLLHKNVISSMGIPLVSGSKKKTKMVMIVIHPAKKRNNPNLMEQRRARNDWAIMKVNSRFTATVTLCPADRISYGNISLGTVQPSGPHDHPKANTKRQIKTTTNIE
ncbi:hypothetical protein PIB30_061925 [Stylosanthes scabra]|uniref:Secreted protein n=1 Tax=Stylosanthes scabra TaxID=79078 RepID=A0ABU6QM02_9FABA|nr:hypothetical protein [Stylosanthes scabra]